MSIVNIPRYVFQVWMILKLSPAKQLENNIIIRSSNYCCTSH